MLPEKHEQAINQNLWTMDLLVKCLQWAAPLMGSRPWTPDPMGSAPRRCPHRAVKAAHDLHRRGSDRNGDRQGERRHRDRDRAKDETDQMERGTANEEESSDRTLQETNKTVWAASAGVSCVRVWERYPSRFSTVKGISASVE